MFLYNQKLKDMKSKKRYYMWPQEEILSRIKITRLYQSHGRHVQESSWKGVQHIRNDGGDIAQNRSFLKEPNGNARNATVTLEVNSPWFVETEERVI